MAKKKIAINGFGRIGRHTFRALFNNPDAEIVAVNDLTDNATLAHLLSYDTAQGPFKATVTSDDTSITVNGKRIPAFSERNPENLPWRKLGVDTVLECTGIFRDRAKASLHLMAGARRVLLSAPAKSNDVKTIVIGVNENELTPDMDIISNASCTTNCFAPIAKIVVDNWGVVAGSLVTVHSYTQDQRLQDAPHRDLRRARAAAMNIIPTTTGAAKAAALVVPEIDGIISAMSYRVPTITGSVIEFNAQTKKETTAEEINAVIKSHANGAMKNILHYSTDELVSSDIIGSSYSSVFDSLLTVANKNHVRLVSWYDNEAGYSARLAQLATMV